MRKNLKSLKRLPQRGQGNTAQRYFIREDAAGYRSARKQVLIVNAHLFAQSKIQKIYPWFVRLWVFLCIFSFVFIKGVKAGNEPWYAKIPKPSDRTLIYVQTDKETYKLDEPININFALINLDEKPFTVDQCNYVIEIRKDGKLIQAVLYNVKIPLSTNNKLNPNSYILKSEVWHQNYWDKEKQKEEKVPPGIYEIYWRYKNTASSVFISISGVDKELDQKKTELFFYIKLTTDKDVYNLGEEIKLIVAIKTLGERGIPVDFACPCCLGEFIIMKEEKEIRREPLIQGACTQNFVTYCFWDEEEFRFEWKWDQVYFKLPQDYWDPSKKQQIPPGKYQLLVTFADKWKSNIVTIEIK